MENNFAGVGLGSNVPIGLGMLLMEDSVAFNRFAGLSEDERTQVIRYVQGGTDGDDAQRRIAHTVKGLRDNIPGFYLQ